ACRGSDPEQAAQSGPAAALDHQPIGLKVRLGRRLDGLKILSRSCVGNPYREMAQLDPGRKMDIECGVAKLQVEKRSDRRAESRGDADPPPHLAAQMHE